MTIGPGCVLVVVAIVFVGVGDEGMEEVDNVEDNNGEGVEVATGDIDGVKETEGVEEDEDVEDGVVVGDDWDDGEEGGKHVEGVE